MKIPEGFLENWCEIDLETRAADEVRAVKKEMPMQTGIGWIDENALYTVPELRRRLDLGPSAVRKAKGEGLRVLRIGRRDYIRGSDLVQFALRINAESGRIDGGHDK